MIERVEIIRGPGSSLYGSSAFFGVINVISKKGKNLKGIEASGEAGGFQTYKGRLSGGNQFATGLDFILSGSLYDSRGDKSLYFNVTTYNDLAVFGNYTSTYRVAAFNANGPSAYAVSNSVLVPPDATPPAAPSNLAASIVAATTLTLNWSDNSNNESGFILQRATDSAPFTKNLVSIPLGAGATSYNDTGLKRNTKYFYRIQAINGFNGGAGPFPWSPTLNVTTLK